ncbi:hypothetical protein BIY23_03000 [Wolbachia pipientis]|uniref:Uncharacterized protein n=2 Tax=Wolbachia pipientis TaxID=955 RepID=A0A1E7QJM4_WOLPI|nr:hypothetical protein BIY23_03000 [Wolbachia pipientis]
MCIIIIGLAYMLGMLSVRNHRIIMNDRIFNATLNAISATCLAIAMYSAVVAVSGCGLKASIAAITIIGLVWWLNGVGLKISHSYQVFKHTNISEQNKFSEVWGDVTINLKDKVLFSGIYLIYLLQLPFLYALPLVDIRNVCCVGYPLTRYMLKLNIILLFLVIPLELIKYPLIKCFIPLGLNAKHLSFLFNISDIENSSQNVHTGTFQDSITRCAIELTQSFPQQLQSTVLDSEIADYINGSNELTVKAIEELKRYLNFNGSNDATWKESKTNLTLTQAINLVYASAKRHGLDLDLLKCILLMRLKEGNGLCTLGMFNRIIYSLSCFDVINNFIVEVNAQVYERMPDLTKEFLDSYSNNKKLKISKENFDDFYNERILTPDKKKCIHQLLQDVKKFVFDRLYLDYYNRYGKEVGRGSIKDKLRELITDDEIKEAISMVIDGIEIKEKPFSYLETIKSFFSRKFDGTSPT